MSSSSTLSKVKVGRQWGYPIMVTTGKSKHEAILLECNTDNPQDFLQNAEVKIRWKVAMYNESVPASNVELQNVDTLYTRSRKSATAVAAVDSKKRKTNASIENPSAVTSGVKVKEEEIETDNDEDIKKPAAVSSSANVKEEEVETDNDDEKKPDEVHSNVKEEEVETDNDEDKKPDAVTSSGGAAVKTEEVETDDEEDKKRPDLATSGAVKTEEVETDKEEDDEEETTLVEFKFCSMGGRITDKYELEGTLHIPMLQDATTGMYSLPIGKTSFRGKLNRVEYNEFEGSFIKTEVKDPATGKTYPSVHFDLGMDIGENKQGKKFVSPRDNIPGEYTVSFPLEFDDGGQVGDFIIWEEEQGGKLVAYENGDDNEAGVELYTVLSVHKPNEESPAPLPEGYEPDWDFLVNAYHARLQARDDNDKDLGYAQAAVREYRQFLALKVGYKGKGDTKSIGYSPSEQIDDVWHTHISFLRRYQCDTLYLTREEKVIEHLPVLSEDSRRAYNNAYYARKFKLGMMKAIPVLDELERFWPNPHEDSSSAESECAVQCGGCG